MRESGVTHCEIETEFDNMLLRRDGYDPVSYTHLDVYKRQAFCIQMQ